MAEMMVPIRSCKQYFKEFAVEGLVKKNARPSLVKEQLLDAFKKEIFGQITMRYHDASILAKPDETVDDATRKGVRNILDQANKKWRTLCKEFAKYKETAHVISPGDLMERIQDIVKIQEGKEVDDSPVDIVEAEVSSDGV